MALAYFSRFLVILPVLALFTGCAAKDKLAPKGLPGLPNSKTRFSVQVNVSDGANDNSPIPVDFVVVTDKKLMAEVAKLPAKDWFERRIQMQRDFPTKVKIVSWEWVPGQHAGPISVALDGHAKYGYFFANYLNGGDHRAAVDLRFPVVVNLGTEDFAVQPLR